MYKWQPIARSQDGYIARKPHNFYCWTGSTIHIVHHTGKSVLNVVYDYYTDADMRKLAQEVGLHVTPEWWQQWNSTRQWFDDIVNSKPVLDLDSYFDMSIPDEKAKSMLNEVA